MKLVIESIYGNVYSADVSLSANREQTVEVLNRLGAGEEVKEIRLEFLNAYSEDGRLKSYPDRKISVTGIRFK